MAIATAGPATVKASRRAGAGAVLPAQSVFVREPAQPAAPESPATPTSANRLDLARRAGVDVLAGREPELAVLDAALERARIGRLEVVLIDGGLGMGKSRLLEAFLEQRDIGRVLLLRCDELEAEVAFATVGLLVDQPTSACSEVEAGQRLLARLSDVQSFTRGVTVLAVDDAQWMDRASAHALRFALRRLQFERLVVVIAGRSVSSTGAGVVEPENAGTVIRPDALDADAVVVLAWELRSWELDRAAAERLVQRAGGVPLLLVAVLRGTTDRGRLESDTATADAAVAAAARMLSSVPRAAQRLVRASAVLAEATDAVMLGRLAGVDDLFAAVHAAVSAGLLVLRPGGDIDCAHDLLREAVYLAIPADDRRALHAEAVRWTSGDRRLTHRASAADRPDADLAAELDEAADATRADLRYALAASQRLQARSVSDDPRRRDDLLLEALIDQVSGQDFADAAGLAGTAEHLPPSALRSLALGLLARETGRIGEARTLLHDALTRARIGGDRVMVHRAGIAAATLSVRINEGRAAVEAIGDIDLIADPAVAGDARSVKALGLWQIGDSDGALALLDGVQLSWGGTAWEADLLGVRGMIRMYAGQLTQALADFNRAVDLQHLWRPSTNQSRVYVMRARTRYWLGDWDGSELDAGTARALTNGAAQAWSAPLVRSVSSDVPLGRGQWRTVREHLRVAQTELARLPSPHSGDAVAERKTDLLLAKQNSAGALILLESLRQDDHLAQGAPSRTYRWILPAWIRACLGTGRQADAERSLADYTAMLQQWPGGPTPDQLGLLRGQLAESRGDSGCARDHYVEQLDDPHLRQLPFMLAQVRVAAGRLERSLGDRRAAIDHLSEALKTFVELQARPSIERCAAELDACGHRPSRASTPALSSREDEVVALVAGDHTNKEIAGQLGITVKAVEYHLSRIYAKLGVSGRQQLLRLHVG